MNRAWWVINIIGYGRFGFFGTEQEADEMRIHKAAWEEGEGTMRPATTNDQSLIAQEISNLRWRLDNGYELEANELEAMKENS